jgi:hypothetical protein
MIVAFCIILSAIGFYLSLNHGDMWPLAWIAPIPVLWLAFGVPRGRARMARPHSGVAGLACAVMTCCCATGCAATVERGSLLAWRSRRAHVGHHHGVSGYPPWRLRC